MTLSINVSLIMKILLTYAMVVRVTIINLILVTWTQKVYLSKLRDYRMITRVVIKVVMPSRVNLLPKWLSWWKLNLKEGPTSNRRLVRALNLWTLVCYYTGIASMAPALESPAMSIPGLEKPRNPAKLIITLPGWALIRVNRFSPLRLLSWISDS